jgi:hypothetical protein
MQHAARTYRHPTNGHIICCIEIGDLSRPKDIQSIERHLTNGANNDGNDKIAVLKQVYR